MKTKKGYLEFWAPRWLPFEIRRLLRRLWYRHIYLKSDHWRKFSNSVRIVKRYRCEYRRKFQQIGAGGRVLSQEWIRCSREGTDVHHLSYENLGHETLEDVILLCRDHHKAEHRKGKHEK